MSDLNRPLVQEPPDGVHAPGVTSDEGLRRRHHALRQPLNALHLFGEALRLQLKDPAQAGLLQNLLDASAAIEQQLDTLFRDLASAGVSAVSQAPVGVPPGPEAASLPGRLPVAPAALTQEPARAALSNVCVVLVDDDEATRLGTQLLLESWGAQVMGFEGLCSLQAYLSQEDAVEPAIAVVDYHLPMPGGGIDALGLLQRRFKRLLPCVLITGDDVAATTNALVDGSIHCLVKPVQPQPLLTGLLKQLREGRPGLRHH